MCTNECVSTSRTLGYQSNPHEPASHPSCISHQPLQRWCSLPFQFAFASRLPQPTYRVISPDKRVKKQWLPLRETLPWCPAAPELPCRSSVSSRLGHSSSPRGDIFQMPGPPRAPESPGPQPVERAITSSLQFPGGRRVCGSGLDPLFCQRKRQNPPAGRSCQCGCTCSQRRNSEWTDSGSRGHPLPLN